MLNENHTRAATARDALDRAGRYQAQPGGYRAFIPAPLPSVPPIQVRGELQSVLSRADLALGRLDGSIQTLPNPDLFVFMYVRKVLYTSGPVP
jgi:cell filamentation protein, protein adenylyltransferase